MTQLGRYAQVAKQELQSYRIVQDAHFSLPYAISAKQEPATSSAVDTQVFLQTRESLENIQRLLRWVSKPVTYAACRTAIKTRIQTAKYNINDGACRLYLFDLSQLLSGILAFAASKLSINS